MSIMPLRFSIFRQILCFLASLLSGMSLCTCIYLSRFFFRQGVVWLLVSVELSSFIRSTWSGVRKPMFATPQTVASEAIGLFILFPFQLIIALLLSSIAPRPNMPSTAFTILRISAVSGAIMHIAYTASLVSIAMLTVPAFDVDVWMRDIDSSPSPFPITIIFAFAFPRIARRFEATRPFVQDTTPEDIPAVCLPDCLPNCRTHDKSTRTCSDHRINAEHGETASPITEIKRPPVLPHTLIRIPNAAERRSSIYVDLHLSS